MTDVSITPRQDCCHERINGARVLVDGVVCADNLTLGDDINAPILAVCPTPLVGSVVRIESGLKNGIVSTADLLVLLTEFGSFCE